MNIREAEIPHCRGSRPLLKIYLAVLCIPLTILPRLQVKE